MTVEARPARKRAVRRRRLTALERAVFESIAYSDVFDFAVMLPEIRRALPVEATLTEVEATLAPDAPLASRICFSGAYYTLAGREALVEVRDRRREASLKLTQRARAWGGWIASLPFVRLVAISGSLAVDNAEPDDDVDYLVVTAPGRVWLARALIMVFVRLARLRGLRLCPNYLVSESALALPEQDAYTARELMQLRPVVGADAYGRLLAENAWVKDVLPNWRPDLLAAESGRPSLIRRLGKLLLGGRLGDALEGWLLRHKAAELTTRAGDNPEAAFDATMCKGHFDGHRARLHHALAERLRLLEGRP